MARVSNAFRSVQGFEDEESEQSIGDPSNGAPLPPASPKTPPKDLAQPNVMLIVGGALVGVATLFFLLK